MEMRADWFTELGQPVGLGGTFPIFDAEADVSVVSNSEDEYYDTCYHADGGNISDMFTQLCRLQLVYNASKQEFSVIALSAWLNDISNESDSCMQSTSRWSTKVKPNPEPIPSPNLKNINPKLNNNSNLTLALT